jgi:acetyltransferase-like isoleucine patch superfamily enzyme
VWIGFDACVLPGVTIGEGSVVGAKSVVNENVPPYTVVAGNPARVIRQLDRNDSGPGEKGVQ